MQETVLPKSNEVKLHDTNVPKKHNSTVQNDKSALKAASVINKRQQPKAKLATPLRPLTSVDHIANVGQVKSETKPAPNPPQLASSAENIHDSLDAAPKAIALINSLTTDQEQIDGPLLAGSLDLDFQLEDLDIPGLSFDEETLPMENYSEVDVLTEDVSEIDVSIVEKKDLMQAETEYMGELLVNLIANFAETSPFDEQFDMLPDQFADEMSIDLEPDDTVERETRLQDIIEEELGPYLSSMEPERIEVVKSSVIELGAMLRIGNLKIENLLSFEKGEVEQRLEMLCIQLFYVLGLNSDASTIEKFMRNIIVANQGANFIESDALSIDRINSLGTHEHKLPINLHLITGLTKLIKRQMNSHLILGRYAILGLQSSA